MLGCRLPEVFGGRQSARSIHFILTFLFVGFTFGHVFMVLATGVLNNMRSIVTGWYEETVSEKPEPAWLQTSKEEMIQNPDNYTIWFKIIFDEFYHYLEDHKI